MDITRMSMEDLTKEIDSSFDIDCPTAIAIFIQECVKDSQKELVEALKDAITHLNDIREVTLSKGLWGRGDDQILNDIEQAFASVERKDNHVV